MKKIKALKIKKDSTVSETIKIRACQIFCTEFPSWGTFGVMEDKGLYFEILGDSGSRVLSKSEADKFWSLVA